MATPTRSPRRGCRRSVSARPFDLSGLHSGALLQRRNVEAEATLPGANRGGRYVGTVTSDPVRLSGSGLTPKRVSRIADSDAEIVIDAAARERMALAARVAEDVARRKPVYGRTTGVGANLDIAVTGAGGGCCAVTPAGRRPIPAPRSPRADGGAGEPAPGRRFGVDPTLVDALAAAVNVGAHPAVHEYGSIGTGDLTALAELGLTLIGERPWAAGSAVPVELSDGDALAFMSSSALTIGQAALAFVELNRLVDAALEVAALTATALGASSEPFDAEVQASRAHPGAVETAHRLRPRLGRAGSARPRSVRRPA